VTVAGPTDNKIGGVVFAGGLALQPAIVIVTSSRNRMTDSPVIRTAYTQHMP
jgi:hypothetical protein